jgi:serine/threonine protein kinase/tetratricopeptide (TPR) repeat protein
MTNPNAENPTTGNLLFAVLALEANLLDRDRFVTACRLWVRQPRVPLVELLQREGWLTSSDKANLEERLAGGVEAALGPTTVAGRPAAPSTVAPVAGDPQPPAETIDRSMRMSSGRSAATIQVPGGERFTLLRPHARGGLGQVSVARDERLKREVALKEIRPDRLDSPRARERFLNEAEITGQLEHPGIVPVYALAEDSAGCPYYAMRFVQGKTLADAIAAFHDPSREADQRARSLLSRDLLRRFVDVCQTVAYAHSKGVIHRDLKPANIMLGDYGETLVLDWGLAKRLPAFDSQSVLTADAETGLAPLAGATPGCENEALTEAGQVLGTPAYMAPEQADGQSVGPAADIYALGAVLYAILTGRPPYMGSGANILAQIRRVPVAPPERVKPGTPLPLAAVCRKALQRAPAERYPHVADLAREVERYLADEPVQAHAEPLLARLGRLGRHHAALVAGTTALLLTAVCALAVSTYLISQQQRQTARQKENAEQQRDRADANFQLARDAVNRTVTYVAEAPGLKLADFHDLRKSLLQSAVPFHEAFVKQKSDDPNLEVERGDAYTRLALLHKEIGDQTAAQADNEAARDIFARLVETDPAVPLYQQRLAANLHGLGFQLEAMGRRTEAEQSFLQAVRLQQALVLSFPEARVYGRDLAIMRTSLGNVFLGKNQLEEAKREYDAAVGLLKPPDDGVSEDLEFTAEYLAATHISLGYLLSRMARPAEAQKEYGAALKLQERLVAKSPKNPTYRTGMAATHNNLGTLLIRMQQGVKAEAEYRAALKVQEVVAEDFPKVVEYRTNLAGSYNNLALLYKDRGDYARAESEFKEAIKLLTVLRKDSPQVVGYRRILGTCHADLAKVLFSELKHAEAATEFNAAIGLQKALAAEFTQDPEHRRQLSSSHEHFGWMLMQLNQNAQALAQYRAAIELREGLSAEGPNLPDQRVELAGCYCNYGCLLKDGGKATEALDWFARAIETVHKALVQDPKSAKARQFLHNGHVSRAQALDQLGRHRDAVLDWNQAVAMASGADRVQGRLKRALSIIRSGQVKQALAEAESLLAERQRDVAVVYDLACLFAQAAAAVKADADQAEKCAASAVLLLRQASEHGFRELAQFKRDPDLDPLRKRMDFKKLMEELEAKNKVR